MSYSITGVLIVLIIVLGVLKITTLILPYLERAHERTLASRHPGPQPPAAARRRATLEMEQGTGKAENSKSPSPAAKA
ncbi:hypothetical protein GSI_11113 [Ganoderma sinense ZZ0214-1]|uniref:Uncharacterized protein n=1 Tax=Ganoderma sinense ZZ0214-1 TaxID=1077348 RepID=A0A2G8RZ62_9APHY|nr:hypothetical protein GSI_11113 [Ganoderma sinense ZZ0214-1]